MAKSQQGTALKKSSGVVSTTETITITPLKEGILRVKLVGLTPYMQNRFSQKALNQLKSTHELGSAGKKGRKKEPRDFQKDFEGAKHISTEGWTGVPAAAFRNACIDACRMCGFKMTHARMSIFIQHDGLDKVDGQPLVKLDGDACEENLSYVRNETGVVDLRCRPMWRNWSINLTVKFDLDQFTKSDVANLLNRAGKQVGIGEGRPFSKKSNGLGLGTFTIENA